MERKGRLKRGNGTKRERKRKRVIVKDTDKQGIEDKEIKPERKRNKQGKIGKEKMK
jgi:hypothetical protein